MDWLSGLIQVGGTIFSSVMSSKAEAAQAEEKTDTYRDNAALAKKEAEYQAWKTNLEASRLTESYNQALAHQVLAYAKGGVRIDKGTAAAMLDESTRRYEQDKMLLLQEGGFNVARAEAGAQSFENRASNASTASRYNQAGILMQGANQITKINWGGSGNDNQISTGLSNQYSGSEIDSMSWL